MAILSKEDLMKAVKNLIGDKTDDETVAFVENLTDTISDLEGKSADTTDWKTKYEDNDKAWKKKYMDRFFNGSDEGKTETEKHSTKETLKDVENEEGKNEDENLSYDDLFSSKNETNKGGILNA